MSHEPLEIAAADPRSPEAAELIAALSREVAARYDFVDDGSGLFAPEDVSGPRGAFLIGRVGGRPVACGAFRPMDGDVAEIKRMFVLDGFRGRGYSKVLLAALEGRAAGAGYAVARLETGVRQPEAVA